MADLKKTYAWIVQPLIVLAILGIGIFGAISFSMSEQNTTSKEQEAYAPSVTTITSTAQNKPITIRGNGALQAHTRISIASQVSGKISYIHPDFRAGGVIKEGKVLVRLEQDDYKLTVIQNEAEVASAQTTLQLETAEASAAQEEWKALNPNIEIPALVSRKPQIAQAKADVKAAKARLARAKLDLKRTQIKMPYDGRIVKADVGLGGIVSQNQIIGELYKNDQFEIPIPLTLEELIWIKPPEEKDTALTNEVVIEFKIGNQTHSLLGKISHIEGELNERTRLARAIVTLLAEDIPDELKTSVVPGLFVTTSIKSPIFEDVHLLPKSAMRTDDLIWAVIDNQIQYIKPNIIYQSGNDIMVNGLSKTIEIITSDLDVATEGMQVRVMENI